MNLFDNLKQLLEKGNSKKFLTNIIIVLIIGVIILLAASTFIDDKPESNLPLDFGNDGKEPTIDDGLIIEDYSNTLEKKLESILCLINGVGNVTVMVTLDDTAERIPAINTTKTEEKTNEKDAQGGIREITREDQSQQVVTNNSNDSLVVIKEVKPSVKGVIVVAEGAEDSQVKEKLYSAVKTVLGISGNKVEIYSRN